MVHGHAHEASQPAQRGPVLDAQTRERLGRHLKAMYEPVIDEPLDPRLAELLQQLESDKRERGGG